MALSCGDAETVSGGIRQHQNASSEASSRYSRSIVNSYIRWFLVPSCDKLRSLLTPRFQDLETIWEPAIDFPERTPREEDLEGQAGC